MGKEKIKTLVLFLLGYLLFGITDSYGLTRNQIIGNAVPFTIVW